MPLFELRCRFCGEKTEVILKSSSEAKEVLCPKCGALMERVFAPSSTKGKYSCGHAHAGGHL